jgi:hypothetical protein
VKRIMLPLLIVVGLAMVATPASAAPATVAHHRSYCHDYGHHHGHGYCHQHRSHHGHYHGYCDDDDDCYYDGCHDHGHHH